MSIDHIAPDWPAPAGVRSLITTRAGGDSAGVFSSLNLGARVGDDPAVVVRNRARLRRLLPAEPLWLRQVHGVQVVDAASASAETEADASVAREPGTVLAILTADCLPILLCERAARAVAIAHAGWRGLAAGIVENTIRALDLPARDLIAYLGPAIGPRAYEVGPEVREAFLRACPEAESAFSAGRPGHYQADLYALARQRLEKTGIMSIHGGNYCTFTDSRRFFSYRRDGETGRMASLIWLAS